MSYLKTKVNDEDVLAFINTIDDKIKRADCLKLIDVLQEITNFEAKMWGSRMVGFGNYTYKTKSGKEGEWFLIGFSPTKTTISLHLMFGLEQEEELLSQLGKFKIGKGCVYIKRLSDVNEFVLKKLMTHTFNNMKKAAL